MRAFDFTGGSQRPREDAKSRMKMIEGVPMRETGTRNSNSLQDATATQLVHDDIQIDTARLELIIRLETADVVGMGLVDPSPQYMELA